MHRSCKSTRLGRDACSVQAAQAAAVGRYAALNETHQVNILVMRLILLVATCF